MVSSRGTLIMTIMHSTNTADARSPLSSSGPGLPGEAVPQKMSESPLLQTESESALKFRWSLAERGHLTVPAFLDRNAGLFLIMASELFFCLAGVTTRLLNGLDKQIPILEVRYALERT